MTLTQTTVTLNDSDWNTLIASCLLSGSKVGETAGYALATLINVQRKHGTDTPIGEYGRPEWTCPDCDCEWDDTLNHCPICSLSPDLSYIKDMPQYCGDDGEPDVDPDHITIHFLVSSTSSELPDRHAELKVEPVGHSAYVVTADTLPPINMCSGDTLQLTL